MRIMGFMAGALLSLAMSGPAAADRNAELPAQLAATLDEFRDRHGCPGATAAVALPDGTVRTASSGLADVETGRPMTDTTPMLAASIGKTFVAVTVLALEGQARLSQGDPLAQYLGERPWFDELPNASAITIGQLLRHQSGLPDHPHLPEFQAAARVRIAARERTFTPEELLGFVTGREALFAPGTAWAYSDTGYILLGLLIEQVTGRRYYDVVAELFIGPLGLASTVPSDRPDVPGLAVGYTVPENPFGLPERTADADGRLVWDPGVEWTGGGLASTAGNLARWGHALFVVYSGEHESLKSRAREHTHGDKGTACICLSQYESLCGYQWEFHYRTCEEHAPGSNGNKMLRTYLEQKWRGEHGWPIFCAK